MEEPVKSRSLTTATTAALGVAVAITLAPPASAMYYGNYMLNIPDRRDFHTWIWSALAPCETTGGPERLNCLSVLSIPQPVAKAANSHSRANLADGRYTMVIDDPFGLRCGDIYYGPTIPTHDVYTWDANTLAGEMVSTFDAGCDGAPGGTLTYPFTLTRM
ncbi:hypothetical protein A5784_02330 [Mycobacterium sp. 852013-50091_SCH5140682]|nr:hypothetical protein A5784_02330 [Mycobacterium sp. 852013-50091_SCH5140682]